MYLHLKRRQLHLIPLFCAIYIIGYFAKPSFLGESKAFAFCYLLFIPVILFYPILNKNILLILFTLVINLICAFRIPNSVDDYNYSIIFKVMKNGINHMSEIASEYGYSVVNWLVSLFVGEYQYAQIIILTISNLILVYAIYKFKEEIEPFYFIVFYYFFLFFRFTLVGMVRIQFACSLFLLFLFYYKEGKVKVANILFVLGVLIHMSFAVNLLVYLPMILEKLSLEKKEKFKIPALLSMGILLTIGILVPMVASFLPSSKYSQYLSSKIEITISLGLILFCIVFILFLYYRYKFLNSSWGHIYNIVLILMLSQIIVKCFLQDIGRVSYYFLFSIPIGFGLIGNELGSNKKRYITDFIFFIVSFAYLVNTQILDGYMGKLWITYNNFIFAL